MMIRIFYIFEIKYEKYGKKYNRAFNPCRKMYDMLGRHDGFFHRIQYNNAVFVANLSDCKCRNIVFMSLSYYTDSCEGSFLCIKIAPYVLEHSKINNK